MTSDTLGIIDLRFPFETHRALDAEGIIPEMVSGGLFAVPEPDQVKLTDEHGTHLGTIPLYRLRAVTPDAVAAYLYDAATRIAEQATDSSWTGDDFADAVLAGRFVFLDQYAGDLVAMYVQAAEDELPVQVLVHRSLLVPAWPAADTPDPG